MLVSINTFDNATTNAKQASEDASKEAQARVQHSIT
jgi:hypothetical protein